ncbi:MAG: VIT and VWA domain-containing protein [Firmicutes bacterium]|nr:VIT and VWA domain-containing protein [Bacillota bacterium]
MKSFARFVPLVLLLLALVVSPVFADGMIIPRPLPDMPAPPNLTIKYHRVNVSIENQIAVTEVDQVFVNEMNRDLEGEYIFPLPEGAALDSFSMDVDGRMVEGKLMDKDEARKIYEDIVRRRKDPALLEYIGRNIVKARVYPIPAKGSKKIKLKYSETLKAENGVVKYHYPLDTEKFSPRPLEEVTITASVSSKIPIKAYYCPTHKMAFTRKSDNLIKASFEKSSFKPDVDFILYYTLSEKDFGLNMTAYRDKDEKDGYFLMFLAPKDKMEKEEAIPKDVVFILDSSGSMAEDNKMENAVKALKYCLSRLKPADRFNIISFSDETAQLAPKGLLQATPENISKAKKYLENKIEAAGGTNIDEALTEGLKPLTEGKNPEYIVFITDGLPTVGQTDTDALIKRISERNKSGARIFTFGVGSDVNTILLEGISGKNRGYPDYIAKGEEMEVKISAFYRKIADPLLSDVEISIPGVDIISVYPKELPDIFRGSQLMLVGKYRGSGPSAVKLTGKRGGKTYTSVYETTFPASDERNNFIPRLWAVRRIGYLLETIRTGGENKELVDEVIRLSRQYGIITPYTSFLVKEPEETKTDHWKKGSLPAPVTTNAPGDGIFNQAQRAESGAESVAASGKIRDYKQAEEIRNDENTESVKTILEKTFYLKNGWWVDSEYDGSEDVKSVKFASEEYFALAKDQKMAKYLSAGEKVLVKYKGKVYKVEP